MRSSDVELVRRPKEARFFAGAPMGPGDKASGFLRAACYMVPMESDAGTIPSDHVRFSIWDADHVVCSISLPRAEAIRLAEFLLSVLDPRSSAEPVSTS